MRKKRREKGEGSREKRRKEEKHSPQKYNKNTSLNVRINK